MRRRVIGRKELGVGPPWNLLGQCTDFVFHSSATGAAAGFEGRRNRIWPDFWRARVRHGHFCLINYFY